MYTNDQSGVVLVPSGWGQLRDVKNNKGKSSLKDPEKGHVRGLHYKIDLIKPLIEEQKVSYSFFVSIRSWNYNIYNEWHEFPVLSFMIKDKQLKKKTPAKLSKYISDVKVMTHEFPVTIAMVHRLLTATSFFIKRIDAGVVPDVEQILMLHKIHPSQKNFYKDRSAEDVALLNNLRQLNEGNNREII